MDDMMQVNESMTISELKPVWWKNNSDTMILTLLVVVVVVVVVMSSFAGIQPAQSQDSTEGESTSYPPNNERSS